MGYESIDPMMERVKLVAGFVVGGTAGNVDTVFKLEESYRGSVAMKSCVERMKADPEMGARIAEGYVSPQYDLEALIAYPPGSLAHTYARLLQSQGLQPHFYPDLPLDDDESYVIMRMRKTHDLHHVVTGFSMKSAGEAGVIAVAAYQFGYPAFMLIDLAGMAASFKFGVGLQHAIDHVENGFAIGRAAKPLAGIKWEAGWEKPVARWREELGIVPVTNGEHSWYDAVPQMYA